MKKLEITVPSLGESITEATISKWFKKKGDHIEKNDVILELETDKVTQEIYATDKGILSKVFFEEGKDVKIGDILAHLDLSKNEEKKSGKKESDEIITNKGKEKINLLIPSLGESITEVVVGKWIVKEGESAEKGEPLVEIETDKVTQELYAEKNVTVEKIVFNEEAIVKVNDIIAILEVNQSNSGKNENDLLTVSTNLIEEEKKSLKLDNLDPSSIRRTGIGNKIKLNDLREFLENKSFSPAARKFLNEKKIDTNNLKNIEEKNKLSKSDLIENITEKHITKEKMHSTEVVQPLSKLRQSIAYRLKEAQNTAAMLTTFNEINMQAVMDIRKRYKEDFLEKYKEKLGFMSFFTKASIMVLKELPEINAEIKNNNIIYKNRYDIGIAVGTDKGLFVPILRNADNLSFAEIERQIRDFGQLAQENKITLDQMKNGTFTISNGGVYGSMLSTPILNSPQSGILGLHNIVKRPVVIDDEVVIRPIMYVALTYDHRIIDGKQAVSFLVRLKKIIENPEIIMFEL